MARDPQPNPPAAPPAAAPPSATSSRLAVLGSRLTAFTTRWVPDAWVIAVLLTLFVYALAVFVAGAPPLVSDTPLPACAEAKTCGAFDAWSGGLWRLLKLASQFALALVAAQACATSRPLFVLMDKLAATTSHRGPRAAIVLMGVFTVVTAWLNWAVNLVMCAAFVPIIAARNPRVDFRLLVATAYIGIGAIWHAGLSGSAPLVSATADNFLIQRGILAEPLPIAETLFAPFNLAYVVVMGAVMVATAALLHPAPADARPATGARLDALRKLAAVPGSGAGTDGAAGTQTPAARLDRSRILSLSVGLALLGHLAVRFSREGSAGWDINGYNAAFLGLALVLHDSPKTFLTGCEQGARNAWGIIVQFPLYAGIFGLMTLTPLAEHMAAWVASLGNATTWPLVVYLLSAVVNYLVPSGGSQWVIEAPYILPAGAEHGISEAVTTMAFAYGDMSTNLIQPFWAIPLLSVTGAAFGEIMGYGVLFFGVAMGVTAVLLLALPALLLMPGWM